MTRHEHPDVRWALGVLLLAVGPGVGAADVPTDVDLRAAYCLKVTDASIRLMADAPKPPTKMLEQLREQVKKKQEEKRERLQAYFRDRSGLLEADATRDALKTVDADAKIDAIGRRPIAERCATECKVTPSATGEGRSCIDTCAAKDEVAKRLDRCVNLDWLSAPPATK